MELTYKEFASKRKKLQLQLAALAAEADLVMSRIQERLLEIAEDIEVETGWQVMIKQSQKELLIEWAHDTACEATDIDQLLLSVDYVNITHTKEGTLCKRVVPVSLASGSSAIAYVSMKTDVYYDSSSLIYMADLTDVTPGAVQALARYTKRVYDNLGIKLIMKIALIDDEECIDTPSTRRSVHDWATHNNLTVSSIREYAFARSAQYSSNGTVMVVRTLEQPPVVFIWDGTYRSVSMTCDKDTGFAHMRELLMSSAVAFADLEAATGEYVQLLQEVASENPARASEA